jgi:hypothetical protein
MSTTLSSKRGSDGRRVAAALLIGVVVGAAVGFAYVRFEHHKREQLVCTSRGLDAAGCDKLLEANRRSWSE